MSLFAISLDFDDSFWSPLMDRDECHYTHSKHNRTERERSFFYCSHGCGGGFGRCCCCYRISSVWETLDCIPSNKGPRGEIL